MYRLLILVLAACLCSAAEQGRVFFMSFDGLGQQIVDTDPAGKELTVLQQLRRKGASAEGLIAAFPSTTSNSHAALWTGAYAAKNGIFYNRNLVLPRAEHTFVERGNGFRSEALSAEPIWVAAARQGVSVVAHQVTQAYPFLPQSVGVERRPELTLINSYQSRSFAPWRALRAADMDRASCREWIGARACFQWSVPTGAGDVRLYAAVMQDRMLVALAPGRSPVEVIAQPLEQAPPLKRELARHFSAPLMMPPMPDGIAAALVFRAFTVDAAAGDFLMVQAPLHETAVFAEGRSNPEMAARLIREAGPTVGNGAHGLYRSGALGKAANNGGAGTAERRYLETLEWVVRQQIAHSNWLFRTRAPRLHMTYLAYPDEMDDQWIALDRAGDARFREFRRWGYVAINRAMDAFVRLAGKRDHVVVVSDHGMTPFTHQVAINVALQDAGLQMTAAKGQIDAARSQAAALSNCVLLNTADWSTGIVKDRAAALQRVEAALRAIRASDGKAVVTNVYTDLSEFGLGGPSSADLCFDLLPGYAPVDALQGEVVRTAESPHGLHGFDPRRKDMQAVLTVRGPGVKVRNLGLLKSITVAPLLTALLGIEPPKDAVGTSPLKRDAK